MSGQGDPSARLRQAFEAGNLPAAAAAARELETVGMADALRLCVLLGDGERERFDRAAVRWLGRLAHEVAGVTLSEMQAAADLLDVLPDDPDEAYTQLQELLAARGVAG